MTNAQRVTIHPSSSLDLEPEWVIFNEFVITSRPYIRTVTAIEGWWLAVSISQFQVMVISHISQAVGARVQLL
jgi:Oligonucleotide/oligosaccharide-binding (OB)-fold